MSNVSGGGSILITDEAHPREESSENFGFTVMACILCFGNLPTTICPGPPLASSPPDRNRLPFAMDFLPPTEKITET
jgi:hypothetical protein